MNNLNVALNTLIAELSDETIILSSTHKTFFDSEDMRNKQIGAEFSTRKVYMVTAYYGSEEHLLGYDLDNEEAVECVRLYATDGVVAEISVQVS